MNRQESQDSWSADRRGCRGKVVVHFDIPNHETFGLKGLPSTLRDPRLPFYLQQADRWKWSLSHHKSFKYGPTESSFSGWSFFHATSL